MRFCTKAQATCRRYRPPSRWKCQVCPSDGCMKKALCLNDECCACDGEFSVHWRKLADSQVWSVAVSALPSITSVISLLIHLRFLSALPPPPCCESGQCGTSPSRGLPARNNSGGFEIEKTGPSRWQSSTSCSGVCFLLRAKTEGQGEESGWGFYRRLPASWLQVTLFSWPLYYRFYPSCSS